MHKFKYMLFIEHKNVKKTCISVNMNEDLCQKKFFCHGLKKLYFSILKTGIHVNLKLVNLRF